jgi:hypothetical protein
VPKPDLKGLDHSVQGCREFSVADVKMESDPVAAAGLDVVRIQALGREAEL